MSPESDRSSYLLGYNLLGEVELLNLSQTENLIEPVVSELIASPQSIPSILTAWAESRVSIGDLCFSDRLLPCHSLFPVDGKLCFTSCDILYRHDSVIFTSATLKFVPSLLCSPKHQHSSQYSFIVTIHFPLDFS